MLQPDLLDIFVLPLEKSGFEYMVTGSVASTIYGEPRLTHDIDLVLILKNEEIKKFCSVFPVENYYCPPTEVICIELSRKNHAHFNLIHHDSGYKADCYPFTGDPLHAWALNQRRIFQIRPDFTIKVAPPEYVIIRKMQFFRDGGSEKHLSDIKKMLQLAERTIDLTILTDWIQSLCLDREWNRIQTGL